jgi:hypothetical protein
VEMFFPRVNRATAVIAAVIINVAVNFSWMCFCFSQASSLRTHEYKLSSL